LQARISLSGALLGLGRRVLEHDDGAIDLGVRVEVGAERADRRRSARARRALGHVD
jgi:hypothetical protein